MVKFGWLQDAHNRADTTEPSPGAQQRMVGDYDWLVNQGVEDIFFTGDLVDHPDGQGGRVPHTTHEEYDQFWNLISQTADPERLRGCVPGNHEAPLQPFLQSDERCVLRKRIDYDDAGVSVFLINTQANNWTTGGSKGSGQSGPATEFPRVPYSDIKWLDEQLADAGSNAKLVMGHAALTSLGLANYGAILKDGAIPESGSHSYNIIQNTKMMEDVLTKHNKVVVLVSHLYQTSVEGAYTNLGGVDSVYKQHYYNVGSDAVNTFGHVDITDTSVTVKTINHSDKTTNTVCLDKTF